MTVAEAAEEIARRKQLGHENILLVVDGSRRMGARARVIPGVMGRVVGHTTDGSATFVDVKLADFERGVERLAMTELAKQAVADLDFTL